MPLLKVLVPGPWWHELTYQSENAVDYLGRVLVPMGWGKRVGLCVGRQDTAPDVEIRPIEAQIDSAAVLSQAYLQAAYITAGAFLCSPGEVLSTLLPSGFWRGEQFPVYDAEKKMPNEPGYEFCYAYEDEARMERYREAVEHSVGSALVLFSEREQAVRFHKTLVGIIPKERLFLWPASGSASALKAWRAVLAAENPVIIGGPGAAGAPLNSSGIVVVDEESSLSWRTKSNPVFSLRSFAAARARSLGWRLILGGRVPSSRVAAGFSPEEQSPPVSRKNALRMIDRAPIPHLEFKGMKFPLPLSDVLLSETSQHVHAGAIVFWLLDRRGASSEIHCSDCGQTILCKRCGTPLVFEKSVLRCPVCGHKQESISRCPACGGRILEGSYPGLELLVPLAKNLLGKSPVMLWHADDPANKTEAKKRIAVLRKEGGLLLGSRRALSLLDELSPTLVAWLDADAESRLPHYSSRFRAYAMLLESCWRGAPHEVMLQGRSFSAPWIRGLQTGWRAFWTTELRERRTLNFPPFTHLVEIKIPRRKSSDFEDLAADLDEAGFMTMRQDADGGKISVFTPHIAPLRRFMEKYFTIQRSRLGFPQIEVWSD